MTKPVIAITMGDPSGVGPEIIVKALSQASVRDSCLPVVIGDLNVMIKTAEDTGEIACTRKIEPLSRIEKLHESMAEIPVIDLKNVPMSGFTYGTVKAAYGKAAGESIEKAVEMALAKKVDAVVTAPLQKEAFTAAGYRFTGHTDMLASLTKAEDASLMLMIGSFRVVHVTLHVSLKEAAKNVTKDKVYQVILRAHDGCLALGVNRPRIGVSGLNPHAGEGGLFGREEIEEITPAVEKAKAQGIKVEGPISPDTIFAMLRGGKFDIVVCMYHDQGGIPMKVLSFEWDKEKEQWAHMRGVNVTFGLPIIRTSVSHGTGFEIAGKGIASPDSLIDAIQTACTMVEVKRVGIRF